MPSEQINNNTPAPSDAENSVTKLSKAASLVLSAKDNNQLYTKSFIDTFENAVAQGRRDHAIGFLQKYQKEYDSSEECVDWEAISDEEEGDEFEEDEEGEGEGTLSQAEESDVEDEPTKKTERNENETETEPEVAPKKATRNVRDPKMTPEQADPDRVHLQEVVSALNAIAAAKLEAKDHPDEKDAILAAIPIFEKKAKQHATERWGFKVNTRITRIKEVAHCDKNGKPYTIAKAELLGNKKRNPHAEEKRRTPKKTTSQKEAPKKDTPKKETSKREKKEKNDRKRETKISNNSKEEATEVEKPKDAPKNKRKIEEEPIVVEEPEPKAAPKTKRKIEEEPIVVEDSDSEGPSPKVAPKNKRKNEEEPTVVEDSDSEGPSPKAFIDSLLSIRSLLGQLPANDQLSNIIKFRSPITVGNQSAGKTSVYKALHVRREWATERLMKDILHMDIAMATKSIVTINTDPNQKTEFIVFCGKKNGIPCSTAEDVKKAYLAHWATYPKGPKGEPALSLTDNIRISIKRDGIPAPIVADSPGFNGEAVIAEVPRNGLCTEEDWTNISDAVMCDNPIFLATVDIHGSKGMVGGDSSTKSFAKALGAKGKKGTIIYCATHCDVFDNRLMKTLVENTEVTFRSNEKVENVAFLIPTENGNSEMALLERFKIAFEGSEFKDKIIFGLDHLNRVLVEKSIENVDQNDLNVIKSSVTETRKNIMTKIKGISAPISTDFVANKMREVYSSSEFKSLLACVTDQCAKTKFLEQLSTFLEKKAPVGRFDNEKDLSVYQRESRAQVAVDENMEEEISSFLREIEFHIELFVRECIERASEEIFESLATKAFQERPKVVKEVVAVTKSIVASKQKNDQLVTFLKMITSTYETAVSVAIASKFDVNSLTHIGKEHKAYTDAVAAAAKKSTAETKYAATMDLFCEFFVRDSVLAFLGALKTLGPDFETKFKERKEREIKEEGQENKPLLENSITICDRIFEHIRIANAFNLSHPELYAPAKKAKTTEGASYGATIKGFLGAMLFRK